MRRPPTPLPEHLTSPGMRGPASRPSKESKDVNDLLHTLRGEHFRRTLNAQRTSRHGVAAFSAPQPVGRSLPYTEIYDLKPHRLSSQALDVDMRTTPTTAAGPIPRSWVATAPAPAVKDTGGPVWRAKALSLFFSQREGDNDPSPSPHPRPCLPSLEEGCLRVLLEYCGHHSTASGDAGELDSESEDSESSSFLEQLAPFLAPHHRKLAVRLCAVHSPLSAAGLRAFWGEAAAEGGRWNQVEGELVVVEPAWSVRPELVRAQVHTRVSPAGGNGEEDQGGSGSEAFGVGEWDVAEHGWQEYEREEEEQQPLTAIAIVSTALSIPALLALPPSLTRLALVHLSAPIPVHRLPDKCPLLELLDISFNPWLAEPAWGEERALERVAWGRWAYLKVLGCRDCGITSEELSKVNDGRWEDVTVIT